MISDRLSHSHEWLARLPGDEALLEETLAGLRGKARDLQNDKWMYEDVRI